MKNKNRIFEKFQKTYIDVCLRYSNSPDNKKLWQIVEKGFLFEFFQRYGDDGSHLIHFFKIVEDVIQRRLEEDYSLNVKKGLEEDYSLTVNKGLNGKFLSFDVSASMYDGVAQDASCGFFDSDDVPPPEFWLGLENDLLISFIPLEFFDVANDGVINCLSGSLEWID